MPGQIFDDMDGKFDARLRRVFPSTKTAKSGDQEIVVTNVVATVEARFDFPTLERLYSPNFIAIEKQGGDTTYLIFEVVGVNPIHFQMLGMDISMPTVLRREYLDTISESWGKSQETWIDMAAVPTWYSMKVENGQPKFERSRTLPLAGANAHLLSKKTVEDFLCFPKGETVGTMLGFELPLTISLENLIRYHAGIFGFSVDYNEPIIYRQNGSISITKIGELVDRYYDGNQEGLVYTSSIEVVSFDPKTFQVKWSPLQYVFRHKFQEKLIKLKLATGRSVTVTPSHSVFILKDGVIRAVSASTIRPGDYAIGAGEIPAPDSRNVRVDLLKFFAESRGVVVRGLDKASIPRGIIKGGSPNREWRWRSKGMIPVSKAYLLSRDDLDKGSISYKGSKHDLPMLLEIDEEMARLIGYYAAEGHISWKEGENYRVEFTLGRKDTKILRDIRHVLSKKFGISPKVEQHGAEGLRVTFSHRCLAELFARWVGRGAAKKSVPKVILDSPQSVRRAFLRAWVEGDYGVTVSQKLMNDIMYLLLMDGCVATSSEWRYKRPVVIEGRKVRSRLRYQMKFPRADEISKGAFRLKRRSREPAFPASQIPSVLRPLHAHPSHLGRTEVTTSKKTIDAMESKLMRLRSYSDSGRKSMEQARNDAFYRRNLSKYFAVDETRIRSNQLLVSLPEEFRDFKAMAESKLSFLRVQEVELVNPTSDYVYDVSVPGTENFLAGFGGVFCHNTGAGKSNLTSVLLRKVMKSNTDIAVVVIDVSGEYATHLIDLLETDGRILSYETMEDAEQLYNSQVIPESLEGSVSDEAIRGIFSGLLKKNLVQKLSVGAGISSLDLASLEELLTSTAEDGKSGAVVAKIGREKLENKFFKEMKLPRSAKLSELNDDAKAELLKLLDDIKSKVNDRTSLYAEVNAIAEYIEEPAEGARGAEEELTPERLAWQLVKDEAPKLNVLYLPDPIEARMIVSRLIRKLLTLRKKQGSRKKILIVLDEAQEYIPGETRDRDGTVNSNAAVEALLRQGRKYRIHCWLATQRVARLNVSALQQLHSYFVSTLPRFYDRMVISESFGLPLEVLERTAQLDTGEWVFVSYKATRRKNVPVFLRTENNEDAVANYLKSSAT
jgi:intein/homing endonuclease/DNA helicase HerA-like ATPase